MARPRAFDESFVVAKATQLFWEQGYRRTTPQNLLEITGLSKSSLYATFGSKQGLFELCLEQYVQSQETLLRKVLSLSSLQEALARYYAGIITMITNKEGPSVCLVASSAIEIDDDAIISPLVANGRERFETVIAERLVLAQEIGEIEKHRDPKVLARFIYSTNLGLIVLGRAGASAKELQEVSDLALSTVCS